MKIRMPVPTSSEVRWSFIIVGACAIGLTMTLCWAIVHKVNQSDNIVAIAVSSASQVDRLNEQIDKQAEAAYDERLALRRQNQTTRAQLNALLKYLREHGIEVPPIVLPPTAPGVGPVVPPKGRPARPPRPRPPGSPGPTATPGPSSPGTDLLCGFVPGLCPLTLPTLLP